MEILEGKVAFITGGGSGIGLGMAEAFCRAGIHVVISDIRQDYLDAAVNSFRQSGCTVHSMCLDVTDRSAVERAAEETERLCGRIDILCNNAGINIIVPVDEANYEDWDWVLDVNLGGVINGLHSFIPRIKAHGEGGHIVNTSSIAGISTGPGTGVYSASKFAIRGLTEALRYDLAPHGIGVSVLCPGTVATNLHDSEQLRPAKYSGIADTSIRQRRAQSGALLAKVLPAGMDPLEVGEKVLQGIRRNDFYIFTHPEFKEEFQEIFDEIIAAIPEGEPDPERLKNELLRRQRKVDALRKSKRSR